MALYRRFSDMFLDDGEEFGGVYHTGDIVRHSGIYACEHCGREIAIAADQRFAGHGHVTRTAEEIISWRLISRVLSG